MARPHRQGPPGEPGLSARGGAPGRGEPDRLPVLAAPPFHLRGFEDRDVPMVAEAASDPLILLASSVPAAAGEEGARQFVRDQQHRLGDGFGYSFVIADDVGDRAVGSIGLWLRDLDLGRASVGYWVLGSARRRGAASAALRAVVRWALLDLGVARLELAVEPHNTASTRTAERAGFVLEGLLRSWQVVGAERRDVYLYSLLRSDL